MGGMRHERFADVTAESDLPAPYVAGHDEDAAENRTYSGSTTIEDY
jgi:hypothetical protein